jgi:hypothetical protein
VAAVLLFVASGLPLRTAGAGMPSASVAGSGSVTAGSWAATAGTPTMTFTSTTDQTSTVTNTGSVALSAIGYKVTVSTPSSGSPTFRLFACTVAWVSTTCSGGAGTQVGGTFAKGSTTTVSSAVVPPLGGSVYLQVEPAAVTSSVTVTLGTSVTAPTQLRTAVKTNQ